MIGRRSLTVWHYDTAMGAAAGEVRLRHLQQRAAVTVLDALTVMWLRGAHEPRVGRVRHGGAGSSSASVLSVVVRALLASSDSGAPAGLGIDGLVDRLRGTGIDRDFLLELRARLTPGTSVLVVLSRDAHPDEVRQVVERGRARGDVTLLHAELSEAAPETLAALVRDTPPGSI